MPFDTILSPLVLPQPSTHPRTHAHTFIHPHPHPHQHTHTHPHTKINIVALRFMCQDVMICACMHGTTTYHKPLESVSMGMIRMIRRRTRGCHQGPRHLSLRLPSSKGHAHCRPCTHARTHTHAHARVHTHSHTYSNIYIYKHP